MSNSPSEHTAYTAASLILTSRQDFVLESGRHSAITTKSPMLHSFFSSCACIFDVFLMYLPYFGCLIFLSTSTTIVWFILLLTTIPSRFRAQLDSLLLIITFLLTHNSFYTCDISLNSAK